MLYYFSITYYMYVSKLVFFFRLFYSF